MGQKVNPNTFRLGNKLVNNWHMIAYSRTKNYGKAVNMNLRIRKTVEDGCKAAQVSKIISEFSNTKLILHIHCRRPGVVVGSTGAGIDSLKKAIFDISHIKDIVINVHEVKYPDLDPNLVAGSVAAQLQKRVAFKKAMKRSVQSSMKQGAQGVQITCSGRLGGAEIARTEKYMEGKLPLHTLRADVEQAKAEAKTPYGIIGVKVWIYRIERALQARRKNMVKK